MADWEVAETFLFFLGEFKNVGKNIDGGGRLFEKELDGGVGDDGTTHFARHEILDVLGDGGETEIVFPGAFGERKEEVGGIVVFHELPGLVDDENAFFLLGTDDVPDVGKDDVHGDRAKLVLEVANVEDDHLVVDVDVGLLGENASEGASGIFAETLGELGTSAFHVEESVIEIDDGRRGGLVG